jgi:hypothetical protein
MEQRGEHAQRRAAADEERTQRLRDDMEEETRRRLAEARSRAAQQQHEQTAQLDVALRRCHATSSTRTRTNMQRVELGLQPIVSSYGQVLQEHGHHHQRRAVAPRAAAADLDKAVARVRDFHTAQREKVAVVTEKRERLVQYVQLHALQEKSERGRAIQAATDREIAAIRERTVAQSETERREAATRQRGFDREKASIQRLLDKEMDKQLSVLKRRQNQKLAIAKVALAAGVLQRMRENSKTPVAGPQVHERDDVDYMTMRDNLLVFYKDLLHLQHDDLRTIYRYYAATSTSSDGFSITELHCFVAHLVSQLMIGYTKSLTRFFGGRCPDDEQHFAELLLDDHEKYRCLPGDASSLEEAIPSVAAFFVQKMHTEASTTNSSRMSSLFNVSKKSKRKASSGVSDDNVSRRTSVESSIDRIPSNFGDGLTDANNREDVTAAFESRGLIITQQSFEKHWQVTLKSLYETIVAYMPSESLRHLLANTCFVTSPQDHDSH